VTKINNPSGTKFLILKTCIDRIKWDTLKWIYSEPVDTRHFAVRDDRRGRGQWFLDEPKYTLWKEGNSESKILWCYGIRMFCTPIHLFLLNINLVLKRAPAKPICCKCCSPLYLASSRLTLAVHSPSTT
jgi:hypothetical protein